METFTTARDFEEDRGYPQARGRVIAALDLASIDGPIRDLVAGFAGLPHCFPLQSCCGHFLCGDEQDRRHLAPIPDGYSGPVRYRIAYLALCLENNARGRMLRGALAELPALDPGYVQFGSADWFWTRWPNSYALQVEPIAHMGRDEVVLEAGEARHVQTIGKRFFEELRAVLTREAGDPVTR